VEIKTEADSNDNTECPHDKPTTGMHSFVCTTTVNVNPRIPDCFQS